MNNIELGLKTILYIVSTLKKTGPTNQLSYIIKYLDRDKYEPVILTMSAEPEDSMMDEFANGLKVSVHSLQLSRIQGLLFAKKALLKFIARHRPDLIHTQGIRADGLVSGLDIPIVSTLRNFPFYDYPMKFGKLKGHLMAQQHFSLVKKEPKQFVVCSQAIGNEFLEHKQISLSVIQNGIDLQKFYPENDKLLLKQRLGLPIDMPVLITVGSLISRKDTKTLIQGVQSLDTNMILLIAGDGSEKEMLQSLAGDNIIFLGNINNVVDYLQASDLFISASLAEGLPNTVLEAMACGLPVVLSDISSHLEIFHQQETDCLFYMKDAEDLTRVLSTVMDRLSDYSQLSLDIINYFSAEKMSMAYQVRYTELING